MKIAVASVFLGEIARGVESWARDLAAALHRRNFDVTLFQSGPVTAPYARQVPCLDHRSATAKYLARLGRWGAWRWGFGTPQTIQQIRFARRLTPILEREHFDIVHMQDAWASRVLETARRKGRHHAKVILGHGTEEPLDFLLHFDHVQELAPCYLDQDRQKGVNGKQWFAIPNFVDCELFRPGDQAAARAKFRLPPDAFIVLDVAALKRTHKRLDWLAKEAAEFRGQKVKENIMLVVAGAKTNETAALLSEMQQALGGGLRVLTDVRRDDMPDLYRAADVFAHAALQEMMPIALIEAMASGLPVIANRAPIFEWIVGEAGTLVDVRQSGSVAAALSPYFSPQFRSGKSTVARQRAVTLFSAEVVVEQIIGMYQHVCNT